MVNRKRCPNFRTQKFRIFTPGLTSAAHALSLSFYVCILPMIAGLTSAAHALSLSFYVCILPMIAGLTSADHALSLCVYYNLFNLV